MGIPLLRCSPQRNRRGPVSPRAGPLLLGRGLAPFINLVDYLEGAQQSLGFYLDALRSRGYERALCVLPHDRVQHSSITGYRLSDHIEQGGFKTEVVKNAGTGAGFP
jgi:hypothetical protein